MSDAATGLLAHYDSLEGTRRAVERLREAGHTELEVFSPVPAPELEHAMEIHTSPVRRWALIGGIIGCLTGWLLTTGTSLAYPMVTQGKPIVSVPPFIVIMFELTILLTGIFAFIGMLVHGKRPKLKLSPHYRADFSVDRWGIFVPAAEEVRDEVAEAVRETEPVKLEASGPERIEPDVPDVYGVSDGGRRAGGPGRPPGSAEPEAGR